MAWLCICWSCLISVRDGRRAEAEAEEVATEVAEPEPEAREEPPTLTADQ